MAKNRKRWLNQEEREKYACIEARIEELDSMKDTADPEEYQRQRSLLVWKLQSLEERSLLRHSENLKDRYKLR